MSKTAKKFQIDQRVVYPSQGVGLIKSIEEKAFKENSIPYYVIYLEVSDMTIMVPVDKAVELGIRPIVAKEEALKALDLISEDYEPIPSDWKLRYQKRPFPASSRVESFPYFFLACLSTTAMGPS